MLYNVFRFGDRGGQLRTAITNPSFVELLVQLLPDKPCWNKRVLCQAGSTFKVLFTEKLSLSGLSFHVAKSSRNPLAPEFPFKF